MGLEDNEVSRNEPLKHKQKLNVLMSVLLSLSLFTFMHWRRKWQPTPVFLPGGSQGRGSLVGCRLWGRTESDTTEATQQQQQHVSAFKTKFNSMLTSFLRGVVGRLLGEKKSALNSNPSWRVTTRISTSRFIISSCPRMVLFYCLHFTDEDTKA